MEVIIPAHCAKNNLNNRIKTDLVTVRENAVVMSGFLRGVQKRWDVGLKECSKAVMQEKKRYRREWMQKRRDSDKLEKAAVHAVRTLPARLASHRT